MLGKSLRFNDGKSDKFWMIRLAGCGHTVQYGRSGTVGQSQTKDFPTEAAALKSYEKLVAEKLKKGYVEDGAIEVAEERVQPVEKTIGATPSLLPKNWQKLAFEEIQSELSITKRQLLEMAAINAIPSEYLHQFEVNQRVEIAKSTATHPKILAKLIEDKQFEVRKGLASNINLPPILMQHLLQDSKSEVRINLAKNPCASSQVLGTLADDPDRKIRKLVALP